MSALYLFTSGPMPTTSLNAPLSTGTATKTLLQVKLETGCQGKIVEWGIGFDAYAAAAPIQVELIEVDVFATVTAYVAADICKLGDPNGPSPTSKLVVVGTSASGYDASAEGTVTASRVLDLQLIPPTNQFLKQFPLGREPVVDVTKSLRIRVKAAATVNAYCYIVLEI